MDKYNKPRSVTPADILIAATVAAENALPKHNRALIDKHDAEYAIWRGRGFPLPAHEELLRAIERIAEDPLATIAFDLRRKANRQHQAQGPNYETPEQAS